MFLLKLRNPWELVVTAQTLGANSSQKVPASTLQTLGANFIKFPSWPVQTLEANLSIGSFLEWQQRLQACLWTRTLTTCSW